MSPYTLCFFNNTLPSPPPLVCFDCVQMMMACRRDASQRCVRRFVGGVCVQYFVLLHIYKSPALIHTVGLRLLIYVQPEQTRKRYYLHRQKRRKIEIWHLEIYYKNGRVSRPLSIRRLSGQLDTYKGYSRLFGILVNNLWL